MSDTEFRQRLAKMQALLAINDAKLMANPKPCLEEMAKRCNRLLRVLDEVDRALSPDCVFDFWGNHADEYHMSQPSDVNGEALIRCNKALEVLRKYRKERFYAK